MESENLKVDEEIIEYKTIARQGIIFYDSIDSTNEEAKRLIREGKIESGIVVAEYQTAGKTTKAIQWFSESGTSILMTMVAKSEKQVSQVQGITLDIGKVVHSVLVNHLEGKDIVIKEPNDILVEGKKICGILTETINHSGKLYLIIGIGINVNTQSFPEFAEGLSPTSMYLETGTVHSRKEIVLNIAEKLGGIV